MIASGKAPTIQDVARLARVSAATVSRVLSNPDMVSPKTRERVFDAVPGDMDGREERSTARRELRDLRNSANIENR
mgnify:CR=1 FL=1